MLIFKGAAPNGSMQISWVHNLFVTVEIKDKVPTNVHDREKLIHEIAFTLSKHSKK